MWADDGMVDLGRLPVSDRLRDDLPAWLALGRRHARHLQAQLGPDWPVLYEAT